MKDQQRLQHCKEVSSQLGFSREGKHKNIPVSLNPFVTKKIKYDYYCHLQTIWQKVLLKVSQDKQFLINLLSPLAQSDRLLQGNLEILKKMNGRPLNEGACFSRIDYIEDQTGQPKITEYNLICVGLQGPTEIFQQKRQAFQKDNSYFNNSIASRSTEAVSEFANLKKNPGIALYVTYNLQKLENEDFCKYDWWKFQQQFSKRQIKIVATNLKQMAEKLSLRENGDLYYGEERVAIVYYRTIYRISDYMFGQEGDIQRSLAAKEMANRSNAINVPPIEFELTNLKRVQTQLGKPEVLRRYATEEQAEMLLKTRVGEWDFDGISKEDFQSLRNKVQANPGNYILKPNREGGSNNIHGSQIIDIIRQEGQNISSYILMQKINAKVHSNTFVDCQVHFTENSIYEIGIYGCVTWSNGQILRNQADGYLIRAKSTQSNQGGIWMGFGRLVLWKLQENDN